MKCIVVVAETYQQFEEYVNTAGKEEMKLLQWLRPCGVAKIEATFIYCRDPIRLAGYSFSDDSKIVYVGSWYNISLETRQEIEKAFLARKAIKE